MLEHVESDLQLLGAFHEHLFDGGRLLLNVPVNEVWRDPRHLREYSSESMRQLLERSGFVIASALEADRWTAFILHNEHVSRSMPRPVFRVLRLFLALLPVSLLDGLEKVLPQRYRFQQLIVVARKA